MIAFLLTLIPSLLTPALNFFTAMKNTQVQLFQARTGHAADVAIAAIQGQAAVQTKWWFAALPPAVIGMTIALYVAKAVAWDKVIGSFAGCAGKGADAICDRWFNTDAMGGDLHWVFITVITGYFGVSLVDKFLNAKG
jgi:hypothetical protein